MHDMGHDEQHEMLCQVLSKLVPILSSDELFLLSYHCGVSISDFYDSPQATPDLFQSMGITNVSADFWLPKVLF
jgi:hypothetical protein